MDTHTEADYRRMLGNPPHDTTVPGIGPGGWDAGKLAREQEQRAHDSRIVYRLYTEQSENLLELVERYFPAATLSFGVGLWSNPDTGRIVREVSRVIEVIGTRDDLQRIVFLAGDIRVTNQQSSVLVTWHTVSLLDVTETAMDVSS